MNLHFLLKGNLMEQQTYGVSGVHVPTPHDNARTRSRLLSPTPTQRERERERGSREGRKRKEPLPISSLRTEGFPGIHPHLIHLVALSSPPIIFSSTFPSHGSLFVDFAFGTSPVSDSKIITIAVVSLFVPLSLFNPRQRLLLRLQLYVSLN